MGVGVVVEKIEHTLHVLRLLVLVPVPVLFASTFASAYVCLPTCPCDYIAAGTTSCPSCPRPGYRTHRDRRIQLGDEIS